MVEYKHPKNTTLEDDDLREALKLHFSQSGTLTEDQLAAYCLSLKRQIHAKDPECEVRDRDLLAVAHGVSVDTFALTVPDKQHQHAVSPCIVMIRAMRRTRRSTNELAASRGPAATRTSSSAGTASFQGILMMRTAWLREDFRIEDCSSDAQWVKAQSKVHLRRSRPAGWHLYQICT